MSCVMLKKSVIDADMLLFSVEPDAQASLAITVNQEALRSKNSELVKLNVLALRFPSKISTLCEDNYATLELVG